MLFCLGGSPAREAPLPITFLLNGSLCSPERGHFVAVTSPTPSPLLPSQHPPQLSITRLSALKAGLVCGANPWDPAQSGCCLDRMMKRRHRVHNAHLPPHPRLCWPGCPPGPEKTMDAARVDATMDMCGGHSNPLLLALTPRCSQEPPSSTAGCLDKWDPRQGTGPGWPKQCITGPQHPPSHCDGRTPGWARRVCDAHSTAGDAAGSVPTLPTVNQGREWECHPRWKLHRRGEQGPLSLLSGASRSLDVLSHATWSPD